MKREIHDLPSAIRGTGERLLSLVWLGAGLWSAFFGSRDFGFATFCVSISILCHLMADTSWREARRNPNA